jgi:hypothetical protein
MMQVKAKIGLMLLLTLPFASLSQNYFESGVFITNTMVPQQEISLDSIVLARYFYSGNAYYDLEAQGPTQVHIYLEEIPFDPYTIISYTKTGDTHYYGHAEFIKIDSLCSGDVGIVQGKTHCSIKWKYSTINPSNHCRIKIGVGNYLYAKTKDSLEGQTRSIYSYNRTGTIASTTIDSLGTLASRKIVVPKYTRCGQIIIDDISHPFAVNGYDEEERMTYAREADDYGFVIHYIYGFVYDSCNREVEHQTLRFGASPENPGQPTSSIFFSYDSMGRLKTEIKNLSFLFDNDIFWPIRNVPFNTRLEIGYFYNKTFAKPSSSVAIYYDRNRNLMPIDRVTENFYYSAQGQIDSTLTIEQGLDSPGTVYGPRTYSERKVIPVYDEHSFAFKNVTWLKYFSSDSPFVRIDDSYCRRREYDTTGNILKQFEHCDTNERLVWSMQYNEFNAPIMQEFYDQSSTGKIQRIWYNWDLISLDTTRELLHD